MTLEDLRGDMSAPDQRDRERTGMPSHAFLLSACLPALAAVARYLLPYEVGTWSLLVWLVGLVPVFLLTRYMGWRGALLGLVWTTAMVVLAELFVSVRTGDPPLWSLVGLVVATTASVALGTGFNWQWWDERPSGPSPSPAVVDDLPTGEVLMYFIDKLFEAARRHPPLTVMLIEVDDFDEYASLYGKAKASETIGMAVQVLQSRTRASNVFGRMDDRTLVVLLHGEGLAATHAVAARVLEEIEALPSPWSGRITLSIGIAGFDPSLSNSDALLAHVRQALDTARRMGGDRVVIAKGASGETLVTSGMIVLQPDGQVREIRSTI